MSDRCRVAVLAPHFGEYATRLAHALGTSADVLLVTEERNFSSECAGLHLAETSRRVCRISYASRYALRGLSLRRVLEYRRICRAIDAFAPDILHVQEQGDRFTASLARRYAARCPVVLTVHDPVPHTGNDTAVARMFAKGLRSLRADAAAFHVHGAFCEAALRPQVDPGKPILATAHGVILVPAAGAAAPPAPGGFLFFGRMEAYKGLDTLLDAIDLLPSNHGLRFVLAGRGPELERHRVRVARRPEIELIDRFLAPLEAVQAFQNAAAVVVPYRNATQSGVISAAFGNARPVVATRVGGLVDAVRENVDGLLVAPDDPAGLAAALQKAADPAVTARLSRGAAEAAAGPFAWPAVAQPLLSLYEDLVSKARAAPKA